MGYADPKIPHRMQIRNKKPWRSHYVRNEHLREAAGESAQHPDSVFFFFFTVNLIIWMFEEMCWRAENKRPVIDDFFQASLRCS